VLWLVGRLAGANVVEQFALVGMLPSALALVLGWRIVRSIAYPLAFLVFAVPFGEALWPAMMEWTARFTVTAVRLSGVPVVRDGLFFELPSGRWSVVEACSGLRYLLAALPLSALYAFLSWRSWVLRALFIVMTAMVAVVANWLRAYLIVMLGHLSGMKLAVGVDHLIYGWVFFGIVMAIVFWIGSTWRERPSGDPPADVGTGADRSPKSPIATHLLALMFAGVLVLSTPSGAAALMDQGKPTAQLNAFRSLIVPIDEPPPKEIYSHAYSGEVSGIFGWIGRDVPVGLRIAQYVRQHENGEMIRHGNGVNPGRADGGRVWNTVVHTTIDPRRSGGSFPAGAVNEYQFTGPTGRYMAWEWFWLNGRVMNDPRRIKLMTAYDLLRGRGDESIAWVLWTPVHGSAEEARGRLREAADRLGAQAALARLR
jgi:exosortase A